MAQGTSYLVKHNPKAINIPQSQPLTSDMVKNNAGGYTYVADRWGQLRRFLVLGSEGGTYYVAEKELTKQNFTSVKECIKEDGVRVVNTVIELARANTCPKPDTLLYTLALVMANGDLAARKAAYSAVASVCDTGYKLLKLADFVDNTKGWGRGTRKAFGMWFRSLPESDLSFQVAKYQNRDGWRMSDILRLSHAKPGTSERGQIFKWIVDGVTPEYNGEINGPYRVIIGMEALKKHYANDPQDIKGAMSLIASYRLPRECVPTELLNNKEVQISMLKNMPFTALLRNLGNLTRIGAISDSNVGEVATKIREGVVGAKVHPIAILSALKVYSNGKGFRGANTWKPFPKIVNALNDAFYASFNEIEQTEKKYLVGIDVSGSMQGGHPTGLEFLGLHEAAGAMAMATLATAPNSDVVLFDTNVSLADISVKRRLDDNVKYIQQRAGGGTDCSLPVRYALQHGIHVDCFVLYTDSETWAGHTHNQAVLEEYRKRFNPNARLVNVQMTANRASMVSGKDKLALEVVGFDTSAPNIIKMFAEGEI